MPELTKEYLDKLLERITVLSNTNKLVIVDCDDGVHILAEMWEAEDKMVTIHPLAKLLTEEETAKLKLEGVEPRVPS